MDETPPATGQGLRGSEAEWTEDLLPPLLLLLSLSFQLQIQLCILKVIKVITLLELMGTEARGEEACGGGTEAWKCRRTRTRTCCKKSPPKTNCKGGQSQTRYGAILRHKLNGSNGMIRVRNRKIVFAKISLIVLGKFLILRQKLSKSCIFTDTGTNAFGDLTVNISKFEQLFSF
jgi:hypothetical protein